MAALQAFNAADGTVYGWPPQIDAVLESDLVRLMRETTASDPIIGFGTTITDKEAVQYVAELREGLRTGKCRLLAVRRGGALIAMCTLRRNTSPNNRHITDFAKGMIAKRCRGGTLLAAAFYEMAVQCEKDGVELVTLDVRANTRAHLIWERYGFEIYGTLADYARVNGESLAGHFMMQKVTRLKLRSLAILNARFDRGRSAATPVQRRIDRIPATASGIGTANE